MALGKGTASKSASGAAMSKYDVEVEARLKALESKGDPVVGGAAFDKLAQLDEKIVAWEGALDAKLADVSTKVSADDAVGLSARVDALEETLDSLIDLLNTVPQVVDHTPGNSGVGGRVAPATTGGTGTSALG